MNTSRNAAHKLNPLIDDMEYSGTFSTVGKVVALIQDLYTEENDIAQDSQSVAGMYWILDCVRAAIDFEVEAKEEKRNGI